MPHTKSCKVILALLLAVFVASCQTTIDPVQKNTRHVRVETITNTGRPVEGVQNIFFNDSTNADVVSRGITDLHGASDHEIAIPNFGKTYSLDISKGQAGPTAYRRTVYPLFLQCRDTVLRFIIPAYVAGVDSSSSGVTTKVDACTDAPKIVTLEFIACPNEVVVQNVEITNTCPQPRDFTIPAQLPPPFSIAVSQSGNPVTGTVTVQPGETLLLQITYSPKNEVSDRSATVSLLNDAGAGVECKLLGRPNTECDHPPATIECDDLDVTTEDIDFGTICIGESAGPQCIPIVNTGSEAIEVRASALPAPYVSELHGPAGERISSPITLQPGQSINVCASITPTAAQSYDETLKLDLKCISSGKTGTATAKVSATGKLCDSCNCPTGSEHHQVTDAVEVGKTIEYDAEIFHNSSKCPVTVALSGKTSDANWTMLETDGYPRRVEAGGTLTSKFSFKATEAKNYTFVLPLTLTLASGKTCTQEAILEAKGCSNACPEFDDPSAFHNNPQSTDPARDTLYLKEQANDKIFVSLPGRQNKSVEECFTITNPDTACDAIRIRVIGPKAPFRNTSGNDMTLGPGRKGDVCFQFFSPTLEDARTHLAQVKSLVYTDLVQIQVLAADNSVICQRDVPLHAEVDTLPRCGERQSLALYGETTTPAPLPLYEVYAFGDQGKLTDSRVGPGYAGQAPPGFPLIGDLYVSNPKSDPTINIVNANNNRGIAHLFQVSTFDEFCDQVESIVKTWKPKLTQQSYKPSVGSLSQGDVLAVKLNGGTYALVLISGIDTGSGNLPKRSIVDFYVLYPIQP